MISGARSRLAIVALLLALLTLVVALELLIFNRSIKKRSWYTPLRQWIGPIGIALLGVVLVPIVFARPNTEIEWTRTLCNIGVDADIAGEGVRIAAFVQVCVLILVSLLGSFHPKATGVKEIGAGLVLTTISLAIALMVRLAKHTLTPVDAAISSMILDGQSMALAIQLAAKETLTSRWQVGVVVSAQLIGFGTVAAIVARFNYGSYASDGCSCLTVFWWGWLDNCQASTSSLEQSVFWTYFACRFIALSQSSFHALWNMSPFDRAEKDARDTGDEIQKRGGTLINITYPHFTPRGSARYGEYPATVTFMYAFYGLLALTSIVSAEMAIHNHHLLPSSGIDSTGQVIGLVIATATVLRAAWLFAFLFVHEHSEMHGFYWPFHLNQSFFTSAQPYMIAPNFTYQPDDLPLGSLLRDPLKLKSKYHDHILVPEEDQHRSTMNGWMHADVSNRNELFCGLVSFMSSRDVVLKADIMQRIYFQPNPEYLSRYATQPEIQNGFGAGTKTITVYVVSGVMIATRLSRISTRMERRGISADVPLDSVVVGPLAASVNVQKEQKDESPFPADVLYGYKVQEVTMTSDGRLV